MKRIILCLALGLLLMNITSGCNQSSDTGTTATPTNSMGTNSMGTNMPATH